MVHELHAWDSDQEHHTGTVTGRYLEAKSGAHLEGEGVCLRERSQSHEGLRNGDAGAGDKFAQLGRSIEAAATDVQHRPLRAVDCVQNGLNVL